MGPVFLLFSQLFKVQFVALCWSILAGACLCWSVLTYLCLCWSILTDVFLLFVLTGVGSQSSHSSSPCPTTEASAPPTWSRNLMQQTLMDEGLRLARLVSHDHVGKPSPRAQSAGKIMNIYNSSII